MITEQERGQLRSLINSPQWQTLLQFADRLCSRMKNDATSSDTEWESMRAFMLADGGAQGIRRFLQEIMRDANHDITPDPNF